MAERWTHERLRVYLSKEEGREKREERRAWSVERGEVGLLLDLVDQIRDGVDIPDDVEASKIPRSFDEAEDMLSALMSGTGTDELKQRFLSVL